MSVDNRPRLAYTIQVCQKVSHYQIISCLYGTEELLSADLTNLPLLLGSKAYTFHRMSRWIPDVVALWIV